MPKAQRAASLAKKAARALAGTPTSGSCLSCSIYSVLSSHGLVSATLLGSTSRSQTPINSKSSDDVIVHQVIPLTRTAESKKRYNNPPATPYNKSVSSAKQATPKSHKHLEGNVWHSESPMTPRILEGSQAAFRQATSAAWVKLLPKLVYPLMAWAQRASEKHTGSLAGVVPEVSACKCGGIRSSCYVSVISFQSL